ncbi:PPE domain-containing protein [Mycobacterium sp.]|uniref:PPE domain-containing protein n=1 Tax=Mycobacterium sp. TaxID=1785 RepID=UPI002D5333DC|nr:PPE domain-containing protein [Mycobacterium sp.]HZA10651.1 PPE domain-containing protein [Mycobacterium sp.]
MAVPGDWAATPPQVLWYELMAGDHAASALSAASAMQALADGLIAEGAAMGLNTSSTAATGFIGAGGTAMTASATEYVAALELLTAWVQEAFTATTQIIDAYHTAEVTMVPGPVCDENRVTQAALVATNFGQNTPAIIALDTEYFGHHWPTNAGAMAAYQSAVLAVLSVLAVPPPLSPLTGNPAAAAADAALGGAEGAANVGMQGATHGMEQATGAAQPVGQAATATPTSAGQAMTGAAPMLLGQLGQLGQSVGQVPQMAGQLPGMFGQLPQMATGMLGPLAGGFNSLGTGAAGADTTASATVSQTALAPGGVGAGGGGGGGVGAPGAAVASSFTRPSSSFNAPNPPKLPSGWSSSSQPPAAVATGTQPMAGGTGGLYGAPMAAMGNEGGAPADKSPARTMQLTGRPTANRGDDREN